MHYLELGGAEMALIGLLHALDPTEIAVDLFVHSHRGPLMKYIPKWVNLLPEVGAYSVIEAPMTMALKRGYIGVAVGRLLAKWKCCQFRKRHPAVGDDSAILQYVGDYVTPILPKINSGVEYDLCISFLIPHNIGRDKVQARKRLAWIHTDYSTVDVDDCRELSLWSAYDRIASISLEVTNSFLKRFPSLSDKIVQIENMLPTDYVRTRSHDFDARPEFQGDINLLSIGRFCTAKNYDNIPDIAKRVVELGQTGLKWYIIGYGGDEALIRSKITEAGMDDHVILLGKKENPYPYIKVCDIYVQPSRYEGKSVTVREAQILGKPVVVTNYPTAKSQINDGIDGVIVPLDNKGCAQGIVEFIGNVDLRNKIAANLEYGNFANEREVDKIYELLK